MDREFTTIETFQVTGRGLAHVVNIGDASPGLHERIVLDGLPCEVVGVMHPVRNDCTAILVRDLV